ncbi:CatB-related O-acetyltransferase [Fulvivirga ligni]|uniref:CatB-related O-acetyltransferase n=1 Tax=Fulvivirga ligni TaxID=2904246 RepID=UPI001F2C5576|nr:CatB-related O-acetyltransferase [Fulvivirga ligni]UII21830.1 CatB-related O-acetyltransferase [Fulvivirga ligni]
MKSLFFTREILTHDNFHIGEFTYGKPSVLFADSGASLHIGKFCSISDDVTIFLGGNHRYDWITTYPFNKIPHFHEKSFHIEGHPSTNGDVVIQNDVWIGRGVTIMSGVNVGNGAVLAAGSVITKDVGHYEIWGGNPAKKIKSRFSDEIIIRLLQDSWWEWDMTKIEEKIEYLMSVPKI